jgi:hypothetical protein
LGKLKHIDVVFGKKTYPPATDFREILELKGLGN